jgi:hypothetical protein
MNRNGTQVSDGNGAKAGNGAVKTASLDPGRLRAALERVQTAQVARRPPSDGVRARDPRVRSNRAAFLALEDERRAIAARLQRTDRHRGERYRDLVLITKLSRLEYEHLVGRIEDGAVTSTPAEDPPALGRHSPAEWGHPWAVGPLVELRATYGDYRRQRDRAGRQLLPGTRASVADQAQRAFERIHERFEALRGRPRSASQPGGETATIARRRRLRIPRVAAIPRLAVVAALGTAAVAVGIGASLDSGTPSSQANLATAAAADLGDSLPVLDYRKPAGRDGGKEAKRPARKPEREPRVQPVAVAPTRPSPTQRTVSQAPVTPAPVPAAPAPAPAPQPSSEPPAPAPQPSPSSGGGGGGGGDGGPVSSLPPPVNNLPPPGSGGG